MRFFLLAALMAAFQAAPAAYAADRPVDPESGQDRQDENADFGQPEDPEPHSGVDPNERGFMPAPDSCWFWWRCDDN